MGQHLKMQTVSCRTLCMGAALTAGLLGYAQPLFAQQSSGGDNAVAERVEVTGSRIRRADIETPSPVQSISAEELKQSGYTTLAQVLENITANGQGTLNQGFSGAFAAGASGISLRGLTTAATLVLVDGHRMAPNALSDDNQRSFVDISNIPMDAIERIEILKDGASAVYGSDAMAGVVNVILKKTAIGTSVGAEAGTSAKGGGTTEHFTLTHGWGDLDQDGYNAFGNLEYRHQSPISYAQRAGSGQWIQSNWIAEGGIDTTPGSTVNPTTAPYPTTRTPYLIDSGGNIVAAPGVTPCSSGSSASNNCTYPFMGNLLPETENLNVLGSYRKLLQDGWVLGVKASLFQSTDHIFQLSNGFNFPATNYYAGFVSGGPNTPLNPSANATPLTYNGYSLGGDIPGAPNANQFTVNSRNYRLAVDLDGRLGDWDIGAGAGYTRNTVRVDYSALLNYVALQSALNNPTTPFSFTGGNSAATMAAIFPSSSQNDTSSLSYLDVHGSKALLKLDGGDLSFGTGISYTYRNMNSPDASAAIEGYAAGTKTAWVVGTQNNASAYAEIAAPVSKSFEFDSAIRFDHFSGGVGNATTPQAGFKWKADDAVTLRGTLATGFRAPNPAENGNAGLAAGVGNSYDPNLCPGGNASNPGAVIRYCNYPAVYFTGGNPNLTPEKSKSGTLGLILEPIRGWSSTVDLYKIKISNQIVTGPAPANPVYGPATQQICADASGNNVVCAPNQPGTFNTGTPLYYPTPLINADSTSTSGVELTTGYRFHVGEYGTLKTSLDYSHVMSYVQDIDGVRYQLAGTHGPSAVGGDTGNPKDKMQLSLNWKWQSWDVTGTINYVGTYNLTDPTPAGLFVTTCAGGGAFGGWFPQNIPNNYCNVASFTTLDTTVFYKYSSNLDMHVSVNNLFDRKPPVDLATYGGMGLPYNPSLHDSGVVGRFINVGIDYDF